MTSGNYTDCIPANLDKTVTNVVKLLERNSLSISTAESCTGGLLSALLTSVPGASSVFELGVCAYSERIKSRILGVPEEIIEKYGVVSEEVAASMIEGAKKASGADVCVSVTGYAGPGGGTADKPVGTVYIGFDIMGSRFVRRPDFSALADKSRRGIRYAAAAYVFETVEESLLKAGLKND